MESWAKFAVDNRIKCTGIQCLFNYHYMMFSSDPLYYIMSPYYISVNATVDL